MQRRELFKNIAATVAASGVALGKASVVEATESKPVLAIFECDRAISHETAERIARYWEHGIEGTPFAGTKAFVLSDGIKLTLIDANGRVLNVRAHEEPEQA